jgi:hypothetical protein
MSHPPRSPLLLIAAPFILGLFASLPPIPILAAALAGALLALPLVLRQAFGRLWRDLTAMRAVLAGRSNLHTGQVHAMLTGAAVQGLVFAGIGHIGGVLVLRAALGLPPVDPDFDQIILIGLAGLLGNAIFKRQKSRALR